MEGTVEILEPIILKRKSNLSQFNVDSTVYSQREIDYEETGEVITDEKFNPTMNLLGSMQNVTPHYNIDKSRWDFMGTFEDLKRIADKLSLMDEKTRQIIKVDESTLTNQFDPFWAHKSLWNSLFIEENARYIDATTSPLNELYVRILRGREDIQQPDRTDQSTFDTDRSNLELTSPNMDKKKKLADSELQKKAMKLYLNLCDNEEKMKRVIDVLNPAGLDAAKTHKDREELIQSEFVSNNEHVAKYGTTAMKQFIEVCELKPEDLEVYYLGIKAIRLAVIRVSTVEGYSFKGELINSGSITSDNQLYNFLKDPDNVQFFIQVEKAVEARESLK